jgi:hypothetical protein
MLSQISRGEDDPVILSTISVWHADSPGVSIQESKCFSELPLLLLYCVQNLRNQELELYKWDEVFLFESCLGRREKGPKLSY